MSTDQKARKAQPSRPGRRRALRVLVALLALACFSVAVSETYVWRQSSGRHSERVADVREGGVGVVLGCAPHLAGRPNMYFYNRMQAAAELWHAGKVTALLVTGDNSSSDYNEAEAMKQALVDRGVPPDAIACDFAGLRTLDSIVRAHRIFGAERLVVVSQQFHNERALAIASHYGIEACGLDAADIGVRSHRLRSWVRERAARVAMMIDLFVLDRQPRHMGRQETLPGEHTPPNPPPVAATLKEGKER